MSLMDHAGDLEAQVDQLEAQEQESEAPEECEACGGSLELLGVLGSVVYHRCRACGLEQGSQS